jgi:hypothetical protein
MPKKPIIVLDVNDQPHDFAARTGAHENKHDGTVTVSDHLSSYTISRAVGQAR